MTVINKSSFLFFLFIISFSLPSNAAIEYKPDAEKKMTIAKKQKKAKKKGLFKRWKEKLILKKINKIQKKIDDKTISKKAKRSITFGVSSILSLAVGALSSLTSLYLLLPLIFSIIALILIIFGTVLSLGVLRKTRHEKEKYRKERKKAFIGLLISLSPIIIPLLLLLFFARFSF